MKIRSWLPILLLLPLGLQAEDLKVGIIGLDTSHVIAIAQLLNDPSNPEHVAGARVVAAFPGGSPDVDSSRTRVAGFTEKMKTQYGVEIVPDIGSLLTKVDVVMLESVDGRKHLEQVKPVFAAKKRVFIDKPLASTYADAKEIARLGRENGVPWFSSSDLRFMDFVPALKAEPVLGAIIWGPAPFEPHQPLELSWYGIHIVELLYTLMGTGCESVTWTFTPDADVVVGRWKDGRIGTVRGARNVPSAHDYGAVTFGAKHVHESGPSSGDAYHQLAVEVVKFFQTGVAPVSTEETLEIFSFMDAAQRSKEAGGAPMRLEP